MDDEDEYQPLTKELLMKASKAFAKLAKMMPLDLSEDPENEIVETCNRAISISEDFD